MNILLEEILAVGATHPRIRKRLVAPEISAARELIRTLARAGVDTTGWEAANLRSLAEELSCLGSARAGRTSASDIQITSLINQAIDEIAADSRKYPRLARHAEGFGFRQALRDAVLELRTMGIDATTIAQSTRRELTLAAGAVLARYSSLLDEKHFLDPAAVFRIALRDFDSEAPYVLTGVVVIAPGLRVRGLRGELIRKLVAHGAISLTGDVPEGIAVPSRMMEVISGKTQQNGYLLSRLAQTYIPPGGTSDPDRNDAEIDLFAASSPYEEVREALRRALGEGCAWDEVELVATDPDTYGIALDTICERLGVGMTSLRGIPFTRTRIGRSLSRWFEWISDGLPADSIRAALESDELSIPNNPGVTAARLVPLFRSLEIGWGRDRYVVALAKLEDGRAIRYHEERTTEALTDCAHLKVLLDEILVVPAVPERGGEANIPSSSSELAEAALHYLTLLRCNDEADKRTLEKLRARLTEVAEADEPRTSFSLALAGLVSGISDLRAWSAVSGTRGVLSAQGGKLFLTDLANAGMTGRKRTFVLGLDADSIGASQVQDPVLLDADRRAIDAENLATSSDRRAEKRFMVYKSLASLRGRVTFSFSTTGEDGRERGPSHLMLQALRLAERDPSLGYKDLHERLLPPACAVPAPNAAIMDARDGWLRALAANPVILNGSAQVKSAFAGLAGGLAAMSARIGQDLCAHHGLIPSAAGRFDPRLTPDRVLSPSSLELLGKCPLAWFYRYGAGIRPAADPEYTPDAWLDALERGSLLHKVFEDFGKTFMTRQDAVFSDEADQAVLRILEAQIAEWRSHIPPPNEIVFQLECEELRSSALSFLMLERETREKNPASRWKALERGFGEDGDESRFTVKDGSFLRVRGRIDRVDDIGDGLLLVIDYKTGSSSGFGKKPKDAPFKGGRQLQAAIYAEVAESLFGARVARFEYWFPTPRGKNDIVPYEREELRSVAPVVASLLEHIATGAFVPTSEADDCKFCDYRGICRVKVDDYGKVISPLAMWAAEHQHDHLQYASMRTRRGHNE